nr:CheR family methyltransferase [uncultured Neokomagataea sp.]
MSNYNFEIIKNLINKKYGLFFPEEKNYLFISRFDKAFIDSGFDCIEDYINNIIINRSEHLIINEITTNYTLFYREEHHFSYLKDFMKRKKENKVRVWSAGCSTGEEVYSIAISINDLCVDKGIKYSILGSDINDKVIKKASKNKYSLEDIKYIKKIYKKFINIDGGNVSFNYEITKNITFKLLNLKNGWNFNFKIDVIFCRNVAIYFDCVSKDQLWERLSKTLIAGGELYIGHSERIHNPSQYGLKAFGINAYRKIS